MADDVEASFRRALASGAVEVKPPEKKPWGQTVGYVRDLNGFLVENLFGDSMTAFPPKSHVMRRKTASREAIRSLTVIPGIGPSLAADLCLLGIQKCRVAQGPQSGKPVSQAVETGWPADRSVRAVRVPLCRLLRDRAPTGSREAEMVALDGRFEPSSERSLTTAKS